MVEAPDRAGSESVKHSGEFKSNEQESPSGSPRGGPVGFFLAMPSLSARWMELLSQKYYGSLVIICAHR
jgi:hypothetical protein